MYRYLLMVVLAITLKSCIRFVNEPTEDDYEPVVMSRTDFEQEVGISDPQPLENPGKIYVYGKFLFVNEKNKGFHIYDNRYPNSPQKVKFLKAVGATDIAIKGEYFYVNQATDLITFHYIESLNSYTLTKRVRNVFPQKQSPGGFSKSVEENQIIVNWLKVTD
ncbi:hypothetical protein [Flammeovirga sp. OC4]|uniref:hypothetical protein n=1 Tax=Flammeovirga sp. OC4 TaxID=1382345 RepID=UPI0005C4BFF5|nr:hypothetical protein [Flammeovirga sp. OC4]